MSQNSLSVDVLSASESLRSLSSVLSQKMVLVEGKKGNVCNSADLNDFFAMFDQLWGTLLNLARRLRDVMRMYNEKKQILGWGLEVNALSTSLNAIEHSFNAARNNALGSFISGGMQFTGALTGGFMQGCSGQLKLATVLELFQYLFFDSFGGNPPLYSCGLSTL